MQATATLPDLPEQRRARQGTRALFAVLGLVTGTWGVHIPDVKRHYALGEGSLSLVLFSVALGSVLSLLVAGRVVHVLGARQAAGASGLLMCLALAAMLLPGTLGALMLLALVLGVTSALFDVAINAEGSALETLSGRRIMSGLHGMFSVGGMAGAAIGALLARSTLAACLQLALVAAACAVALLPAVRVLLPAHPSAPAVGTEGSADRRSFRRRLMVPAALCALGMLAEGAMYDWSVLYMAQETGAAADVAAWGYAAFAGAMAAMRFVGDALRMRWSPARLLAASAALTAVSMLAVLVIGTPTAALIGFALAGIGLANVVPILYALSAQQPDVPPPVGIAIVSSVGYLGFLAGPPIVGAVAYHSSLTGGLALVVVAAGVLALVSPGLRGAARPLTVAPAREAGRPA